MSTFPRELLRQIFEECDQNGQIACTQVCEEWSEVALDVVWYEVESLGRIANILSPVKVTVDKRSYHKRFEWSVGRKSWQRFESKYSGRVRILHRGAIDCSDIIREMSIIRPPGSEIFPNLRTLTWSAFEDDGFLEPVMFLHDGVKKCTFSTSARDSVDVGLKPLLEALQHRAPSIVSLTIHCSSTQDITVYLVNTLRALPSLEYLQLHACAETSSILGCLDMHTKLREISLWRPRNLPSLTSTIGNVIPYIPSLESLRMSAEHYTTILPLFQHQTLDHLSVVHIEIGTAEASNSIKGFFRAFASRCPAITNLKITYSGRREDSDDALYFEDIQDVLNCDKITNFTFSSSCPFHLSDEDFRAIALAWPQLCLIDLCAYFSLPDSRKLSLYAVFLLTRLCPDLVEVYLPINVQVSKTPLFHYDDVSLLNRSQMIGHKVTTLEVLGMGRHYQVEAGEQYKLAELLGQVCGPECLIDYDIPRNLDDKNKTRWRPGGRP